MSQQGPGGYGGGGPFGPPGGGGGGYPPGGGAPPGGYGPPGGAPPGGYGPPGAPPGPGGYGPPGAPPGPGGYGPPGAPPGPGGYGPPGPGGYGPPGAPPGYGPPQPGYGYPPGVPGAPPPKKSKALMWVGIGCGGLLLLGIAGSVASYLYMKSQVSAAETAIAAAASAGGLGAPPSGTISATCAKAVACCQSAMSKSVGSDSAIAAAACTALGSQADQTCAQLYDSYKRSAALSGAVCP